MSDANDCDHDVERGSVEGTADAVNGDETVQMLTEMKSGIAPVSLQVFAANGK